MKPQSEDKLGYITFRGASGRSWCKGDIFRGISLARILLNSFGLLRFSKSSKYIWFAILAILEFAQVPTSVQEISGFLKVLLWQE